MRLALDTAPLIYLVERVSPYAEVVRQRLAVPGTETAVCELARLELRVKPLRDGDMALVQDFDDFLAGQVSEVVPITRAVLERAAALRARHGFLKTPDAIHLAAAIVTGCDAFFTNDHRLDRCGDGEIAVEVLAF